MAKQGPKAKPSTPEHSEHRHALDVVEGFVTLTDQYQAPLYVRPGAISAIEPTGKDGSCIVTVSGQRFAIAETLAELVARLGEHRK